MEESLMFRRRRDRLRRLNRLQLPIAISFQVVGASGIVSQEHLHRQLIRPRFLSARNTRFRLLVTGSTIPLSAPASTARLRNASLISFRQGMPNETLLKPPVRWMLSPYLARNCRNASRQCTTNWLSTEIGNTSASTNRRSSGIPFASAASTI